MSPCITNFPPRKPRMTHAYYAIFRLDLFESDISELYGSSRDISALLIAPIARLYFAALAALLFAVVLFVTMSRVLQVSGGL